MLERLIGKKVRIYLKNGFYHAGTVLEVTDMFITIKEPRYALDIILNTSMIDRILEEK